MIEFDAARMRADISALNERFKELPRHIARKHLKAAVGRVLKPAVPSVRALTPPIGTRRGRRRKGEKARSTGALRRSVKVKTKAVGLAAYGVVGYRGGDQSLKAIWLEFGTSHGIAPRRMIGTFVEQYANTAMTTLSAELAESLERAARELASGMNPGRGN